MTEYCLTLNERDKRYDDKTDFIETFLDNAKILYTYEIDVSDSFYTNYIFETDRENYNFLLEIISKIM
jgi:hypothetical protein